MALTFSIKQTGVPAGAALAGAVLPALALALGWRGALLAVAARRCRASSLAAEPTRTALDLPASRPPPALAGGRCSQPLRHGAADAARCVELSL